MTKLAISTIVLSIVASSVFAAEPVASTAGTNSSIGAGAGGGAGAGAGVGVGAGVGAGATVSAAVAGSALILPAAALLATVAVVASDGGDQASEDVGKIKRKPTPPKKPEPYKVKGEATIPSELDMRGPSARPGGSAAEHIKNPKIAVVPPVVTEGGPTTSSKPPAVSLPTSTKGDSGAKKTLIDKIAKAMTESGTGTAAAGIGSTTSNAPPAGNPPTPTTGDSEPKKTLIDKIVKAMTESGTITGLPGATSASTTGTD